MADGRQAVRVSGNLVKWFQGHNIFGTNNMRALVLKAIERVLLAGGLTGSESDIASWHAGDIEIHRADVTESADFDNEKRVLNALRSLDQTATLKIRGRGMFNGHSLLFGKGSRNWSLQIYSKGTELRKHPLPPELRETPLQAFADRLLRMEFRLLAMHLKKLNLEMLWAWGDNTASMVHQMMLQNLNIADANMLDTTVIDGLPTRLKGVYQLWLDGYDLRTMYPKNTFYRYRRALMGYGVDISIKQDRSTESSNVVPIKVVLVGKPVSVPDWAINSPLYFNPCIDFRTREAA
jgi:II/X family phage/plasmid replication protein